MINICTKLSKKIKEAFNYINKRMSKASKKVPENNENRNLIRLYCNGKYMGPVSQIRIGNKKYSEESEIKISMHGQYEGAFEMKISPHIIKKVNRTIENRRLFNILRKTRKKRTKKKLAKRIIRNYVLNKLDKY